MEVIFLQDVPNVANAGEVRRVRDGFARNYLIPQKLAILANPEAIKQANRLKEVGRVRRIRETDRLETLAMELEGTSVTVAAKVSPTGRFYGAISPAQISEALSAATGREIDRKIVELMEPIREPGEVEVTLNLATDIAATIIIVAEAEE